MHIAYSYTLNEQGTQHCSLQSSIDPYLPCSAAIKFHNIIYTPTYHTDHNYTIHTHTYQHCSWSPQFLHTGKTDHICHAQYSKYIVYCSHPQHKPHPMHINIHHTAFHNPLHTTNKHTKHICVSSGKMAQDVGMVLWCHSHLVCFVRVPSLPALVFIEKTFCDLYNVVLI